MTKKHEHGTAAPNGARPLPLLRVDALAKAFGATRALRSCSFELRPGEIHAIIGENGSGKSTLVKILSGVHRADAGTIELDGEPRSGRWSPRVAQEAGIVTVFQEVLVLRSRSVLQNVWLGRDGIISAHADAGRKRELTTAALTEVRGAALPLDVPVSALSLSDRQVCCIARALVRDPRVLILDESTSALDIAVRDRLFAALRGLTARGTGVIFISHRMGEIDELADRITVLRSGTSVASFARGGVTADELVRQMTGSEHLTGAAARRREAKPRLGEVLLRTGQLSLRRGSAPIEFELQAGELVGLAGLEGHGQDAFLQALRGAGQLGGGVETADGHVLRSPRAAFDAKVVYVPRDRRDESIFPVLSITENFAAPTVGEGGRLGFVNWREANRRFRGYVQRLAIRAADARLPIPVLSGGNQQKVVVARWLAAHPRVLLLNDPTRGVDLGAKRDLYRVLEQIVADGVGVVMLSTELDEHIELMDRVLVFREGTVEAEVPRDELSRERLVSHFFGAAVSRVA